MLDRKCPHASLNVVVLKGGVGNGRLEALDVALEAAAGGGKTAARVRVLELDEGRDVQTLADGGLLGRDGIHRGGTRDQDDDAAADVVEIDVVEVDGHLEGDAADVLA